MIGIFDNYKVKVEIKSDNFWSSCIFAFDTNVLLNFYRYSEITSTHLEEALLHYSDRIWIPYYAGYEFHENREIVVKEQIDSYNLPSKHLKTLSKLFSNKRGHPFIDEEILTDFKNVSNKINSEFEKQKKKLSKIYFNDDIIQRVYKLFNNRIGPPYSVKELEVCYFEAEKRFEYNQPPGFLDIHKSKPKRFGDYIIWKQLIDKAKLEKKPILFVSDDEKEDWVNVVNGQIVGPLPALVKEFKDLTDQNFFICKASFFLEKAFNEMKKSIDSPTISEMDNIASSLKNNKDQELFNFYRIDFVVKPNVGSVINLQQLYSALENKGYSVETKESNSESIHLYLYVPFYDLVRRFRTFLQSLAYDFDLQITYFHSDDE